MILLLMLVVVTGSLLAQSGNPERRVTVGQWENVSVVSLEGEPVAREIILFAKDLAEKFLLWSNPADLNFSQVAWEIELVNPKQPNGSDLNLRALFKGTKEAFAVYSHPTHHDYHDKNLPDKKLLYEAYAGIRAAIQERLKTSLLQLAVAKRP